MVSPTSPPLLNQFRNKRLKGLSPPLPPLSSLSPYYAAIQVSQTTTLRLKIGSITERAEGGTTQNEEGELSGEQGRQRERV